MTISTIYCDANGAWDARNESNQIIAVGGGLPIPRPGETLDEWNERRDKEAA